MNALSHMLKRLQLHDPIKECPVYLERGCSHVDGPICDMQTCDILLNPKNIEPRTKDHD